MYQAAPLENTGILFAAPPTARLPKVVESASETKLLAPAPTTAAAGKATTVTTVVLAMDADTVSAIMSPFTSMPSLTVTNEESSDDMLLTTKLGVVTTLLAITCELLTILPAANIAPLVCKIYVPGSVMEGLNTTTLAVPVTFMVIAPFAYTNTLLLPFSM